MHTTLNRIYEAGPCKRGWGAILNYTRKAAPDDTPIPMRQVLEAVGLLGAIWCLRTIDGAEAEKEEFHNFCNQGATQEQITVKFLELFG